MKTHLKKLTESG